MFNISDKAVNEISRLLSEEEDKNNVFENPCCPWWMFGASYEMGFDNEIDSSDQIFEESNIKVVIDKFSYGHVDGGTLNFSDGLNGTGFGIDNPNATAQCGCGSSFTV